MAWPPEAAFAVRSDLPAPELMAATGFAVAGGRSSRMGRDKALLPWGASTLLDHALARLSAVCAEVWILSGPESRYVDRGIPVEADSVRDAGALGGVLTGLARLQVRPGLFLAVDLPFVPEPLLRELLRLSDGFDAVVPISEAGSEPLCAVYGPRCLGPVRRCIERGALKMTSFWPEVRVREMGVRELAAFGDPARLFHNVNTPEDYGRAT